MVRITRRVSGKIELASLGYEGTEIILVRKIMDLTGGKPLEIRAKGTGFDVTLNLMGKGDVTFLGSITFEEDIYKEEV